MTKKRKNHNKWWYQLGMLVVVVLIVVGVFLIIRDKQDGYGGVDEPTISDDFENKKEEPVKQEEPTEEELEKEETHQYEGQDPNKEENLSGVITFAGISGDKLMIRVNIDQYLENGSCALTLSRGDVTIYSDRANIVGVASTATCEGFDVPLSKLGEGKVQININLKAGNKTGVIRGEAEI